MISKSGCVLFLVFCAGLSAISNGGPTPQQPTSKDSIYLGSWEESTKGSRFASFRGIPYALPPIGKLRFKDPEPVFPPTSPVEVFRDGSSCMQLTGIGDTEMQGSEDCLYLNIYTKMKEKSPVMIWIHGGSWNFGSNNISHYGPHRLMNEDIVLVAINYRLGPLGFISLENKLLPGNYGLKDQEEAIKWIHKNIHNFGGDPEKITLFGQSAGAASVMYHMQGRISDLIKRGIAQSGSTLNPWALGSPGFVRSSTIHVSEVLGCPKKNDELILKCLQSASARDITNATNKFNILDAASVPFRPVIEENGIIQKDPWEFNTNSKLPLMIGFNADESALIASLLSRRSGAVLTIVSALFRNIAKQLLMFDRYLEDPENSNLVENMFKFYYTHEENTLQPFIEVTSDAWFIYPIILEAKRYSGPTFPYIFNHSSELNLWGENTQNLEKFGVSHGDELPFLFKSINHDFSGTNNAEEYERISDNMIKMWTDFAKEKSPNPKTENMKQHNAEIAWETVSENGAFLEIRNSTYFKYTKLGEDGENNRLTERIKFWRSLPLKL